MTFADRLRAALAGSGISQAELARRLSVSRSYVNHLLAGTHVPKTLGLYCRIAAALGCDPQALDPRLASTKETINV